MDDEEKLIADYLEALRKMPPEEYAEYKTRMYEKAAGDPGLTGFFAEAFSFTDRRRNFRKRFHIVGADPGASS